MSNGWQLFAAMTEAAVASVIARHVRASDVVARLGGDEFAVLLWHLSEADAQGKAQLLEAAIARTICVCRSSGERKAAPTSMRGQLAIQYVA